VFENIIWIKWYKVSCDALTLYNSKKVKSLTVVDSRGPDHRVFDGSH